MMVDNINIPPLTDAQQALVTENQGFAFSIAMEYCPVDRHDDFNDMVQCANLGLIEAAHRFEPAKGWKFISYAVHWIRRYCTEQVQQRTVRRPSNHHKPKLRYIEARLTQELGRFPTRQEIFEAAEVTEKAGNDHLSAMEPTSSLDYQIADHKECFMDLIAQADATQQEVLEDVETSDVVREALAQLDPRLRQVVEDYAFKGLTYDDIGANLGVTRERVRQLKNMAYRKLRRILYDEIDLEDYLDDVPPPDDEYEPVLNRGSSITKSRIDQQVARTRNAVKRYLRKEGIRNGTDG